MLFKSKIGKLIELTAERKSHIFEFHPDIKPHFSKIQQVLQDPDEIRKSQHDPEALLFYKHFVEIKKGKYLTVVVKVNERSFVLTCYLTNKILTDKKLYEKK